MISAVRAACYDASCRFPEQDGRCQLAREQRLAGMDSGSSGARAAVLAREQGKE